MNYKRILLTIFVLLLVVGLGFGAKILVLDRRPQAQAALRVDSFPKTTVLLNDKEVGSAPYFDDKIPPGEYKIQLLPVNNGSGAYQPWETKIKLTESTLTYVSRDLAANDDLASGQILTLDRLASAKSSELTVISTPDGANVTVDGLSKGQAPVTLRDINVSDHEIIVSVDGHSDQVVRGKIVAGYRLNAIVKLAKLPFNQQQVATSSAQPRPTSELISPGNSQSTPAKPYAVIQTTPTGYLRVRVAPDLTATETAQVKPGETYPLLAETSGWDQIKLASISGWVSDQYVNKIK